MNLKPDRPEGNKNDGEIHLLLNECMSGDGLINESLKEKQMTPKQSNNERDRETEKSLQTAGMTQHKLF